jgi:hypothetical protein
VDVPLTAKVLLSTYPVPVDVQLRDIDVASVALQDSVKFWPAVIGVGVRVTVTTGAGGATVVMVSAFVALPPLPVAVQVQLDG